MGNNCCSRDIDEYKEGLNYPLKEEIAFASGELGQKLKRTRKIKIVDNDIEIDKFLEKYKVKMLVFGGNGSLYESYLCSLKKK